MVLGGRMCRGGLGGVGAGQKCGAEAGRPGSGAALLALRQVEYFNNATIVELVERPHRGILAVLDEACSTAGPITDRIFLQTLDTHHRHHPHYTSRQVHLCPRRSPPHPTPAGPSSGRCPTCSLSGVGSLLMARPPLQDCLPLFSPTPSVSLLWPVPCPQLCPTDKTMEFGRDFRIKHYAGDVT